jgi:hypothetical protein
MRGRKEKGIRGGDAEPRFHSASLHGILLVGRHSRHLFGHPFDSRCARSTGFPHPRRWRSLGPYCVASLLALRRHTVASAGAFRRCLSPASLLHGHPRLTTSFRSWSNDAAMPLRGQPKDGRLAAIAPVPRSFLLEKHSTQKKDSTGGIPGADPNWASACASQVAQRGGGGGLARWWRSSG